MFLFYRLLLAHLIADFPLQFSRLFRLKMEGIKGTILHGSVFGILAILMSVPYIKLSFVGIYLIFLWVFHILIDWTKVKIMTRFKKDNLALFLWDQAMHLVSMAIVIPFSLKRSQPSFLGSLYLSDMFIVTAILYVVASFAATVIIYYLKKSFVSPDTLFPGSGKYLDTLERSLVFVLIVLPGYFYVLVPAVIAVKSAVCIKKKFHSNNYDFSLFNLVASYSIAIASAVILRFIKF